MNVAALVNTDVGSGGSRTGRNGSSQAPSAESRNLHAKYASKLAAREDISRALVSFQANKATPFYRWFKYREGFSSELVKYVLTKFRPAKKVCRVLDPFAGAGTTLSTGTKGGWKAVGIEVLPVGVAAIEARLAADRVDVEEFEAAVQEWRGKSGLRANGYTFPHIAITEKAFSAETEREIGLFLKFLKSIEDKYVSFLLWFACVAVLEEVSFTRKDGQYLRWDMRCGRALKSKKQFRKLEIPTFRSALDAKLKVMIEDLRTRNGGSVGKKAKLIKGSCLSILPRLKANYFDVVLTSPPYCNRYDYTRTYALELAFMGCDEEEMKSLRQSLLSCTVENRSKRTELRKSYERTKHESLFQRAEKAFEEQRVLQEVLTFLRDKRDAGELNNGNIPKLVENYFFEMSVVIHELERVLVRGGRVVMINDNVQYSGKEIPVDLILSDIAASAGLETEIIWVLDQKKGNSSQQMGEFGRNELRKCVYVWKKPEIVKALESKN